MTFIGGAAAVRHMRGPGARDEDEHGNEGKGKCDESSG